jgi:phospholipid-transporting ATPase
VKLKGFPTSVKIDHESFILGGSIVKGIPWAFGLIVYTGNETKIQNALTKPRKKISRIEKIVNWYVLFILGILFLTVILSTVMSKYAARNLYWDTSSTHNFLMFVLVYNNIIPISMFIVMDIVRLFQTIFIQSDMSMFN